MIEYQNIKKLFSFKYLYKVVVFIQQMPFFVFENSSKEVHICIVSLNNEIELTEMRMFSNNIGRLKALAPRAFSLLFLLLLGTSSFAQGWERYYELGNAYEIRDIVQAEDEGFLFTGRAGSQTSVIYRINAQGDVVWLRDDFLNVNNESGNAVIEASNGDVIMAGYCDGCGDFGEEDGRVIRLDRFGNTIWEKFYGFGGDEQLYDIIEFENGDLGFVGFTQIDDADGKNIYVVRAANDGTVIWDKTLKGLNNGTRDDEGRAILESETGDIYIAGITRNTNEVNQPYLLNLQANGDSVWATAFGDGTVETQIFDFTTVENGGGQTDGFVLCGYIGNSRDYYIQLSDINGNSIDDPSIFGKPSLRDQFNSIQKADDGGYLLGGVSESSPINALPSLVKVDENLDLIWERPLSDPDGLLVNGYLNAIHLTDKEQVICGGYRSLPDDPTTGSFYATLTSTSGNYFSNVVKGKIFLDDSEDCLFDTGEEPVRGWVVVLRGNDQTFYGSSNPDGDFEIFCGQGTFQLGIIQPNDSWSPCFNGYNFNLNSDFVTTTLDFPVQIKEDCSFAEVSIAVPYLTPCENAIYEVSYENSGSKAINNGFVEIEFDNELTFINSNVPETDLGNNKYRFNIGLIPSLTSDQFSVEVALACDALEGKAHKVVAEIFPQDLCATVDPAWDNSSLEISAELDDVNEVIEFTIQNVGTGPTTDIQESVIIEDHVIFRVLPNDVILSPFDPIPITSEIPATGKTYRIITPQSANHPGDSRPTLSVEAFAPGGQTPSLGIATELPDDDYNPYRAISHEENIDINTYPEQFKRGYPKGFDQDRKIDSQTDLTYQINFRNTGTEEAIRVVIRDTISTYLDPATIQMGASSHDYTYEIYGNGILKITFEDFMLSPNGGVESDGFVKYRISQKPGNPDGVLVKNGASIYFDYQAKSLTNTNCHLLESDLIENLMVFITQPIPGLESVEAFPNPFIENTTIEIKGDFNIDNGTITVYDSMGKLLRNIPFSGKKIELARTDLPAGTLFFHIKSDNTLIATGQLIAQ